MDKKRAVRALLLLAVAALCVGARAVENAVPVHVIYVQFFDRDVRHMNQGNSLHVIAPSMRDELQALVSVYTTTHEVIAMLTATCTRHTKMTTEVENVELETFLFLYTAEDAAKMHLYGIAPALPEPEEVAPPSLSRREKKAARKPIPPVSVANNEL